MKKAPLPEGEGLSLVMDGEQDDDERDGDAGGRPQPGAAALFAVIDEQREAA